MSLKRVPKAKKGLWVMPPCLTLCTQQASSQTKGEIHHDDMSSSSSEKKRAVPESNKSRQEETQREKREARSLPRSKTAPKAQKGAWETQVFYIVDFELQVTVGSS